MNFKFNQDYSRSSADPFYDLTSGGYLDVDDMLTDKEQAKQVNAALSLVQRFIEEAMDNGIIGEA